MLSTLKDRLIFWRKILGIFEKELVLAIDLPSCPKGRVFKEDIEGNFYHSMTDDEAIEGKLKSYKFTKKEVLDNPQWFREVKNQIDLLPTFIKYFSDAKTQNISVFDDNPELQIVHIRQLDCESEADNFITRELDYNPDANICDLGLLTYFEDRFNCVILIMQEYLIVSNELRKPHEFLIFDVQKLYLDAKDSKIKFVFKQNPVVIASYK